MLCRENRQSRRDSKRVRSEQGALQIPQRDSDQSPHSGPIGCKARQVRGNARWRREPGGGNTDQPEADNLRGSAEKADREKLNDERGIKPLPVSRSRDGAESGKT